MAMSWESCHELICVSDAVRISHFCLSPNLSCKKNKIHEWYKENKRSIYADHLSCSLRPKEQRREPARLAQDCTYALADGKPVGIGLVMKPVDPGAVTEPEIGRVPLPSVG